MTRFLHRLFYVFQFTGLRLVVNYCIKQRALYVNNLWILWAMIYILPCSGRSWWGHTPAPPIFRPNLGLKSWKKFFCKTGPLPFFRVYFTCSQHIKSNKGWLRVTIPYKSTVPFDNKDSLILTLKGLQWYYIERLESTGQPYLPG